GNQQGVVVFDRDETRPVALRGGVLIALRIGSRHDDERRPLDVGAGELVERGGHFHRHHRAGFPDYLAQLFLGFDAMWIVHVRLRRRRVYVNAWAAASGGVSHENTNVSKLRSAKGLLAFRVGPLWAFDPEATAVRTRRSERRSVIRERNVVERIVALRNHGDHLRAAPARFRALLGVPAAAGADQARGKKLDHWLGLLEHTLGQRTALPVEVNALRLFALRRETEDTRRRHRTQLLEHRWTHDGIVLEIGNPGLLRRAADDG